MCRDKKESSNAWQFTILLSVKVNLIYYVNEDIAEFHVSVNLQRVQLFSSAVSLM